MHHTPGVEVLFIPLFERKMTWSPSWVPLHLHHVNSCALVGSTAVMRGSWHWRLLAHVITGLVSSCSHNLPFLLYSHFLCNVLCNVSYTPFFFSFFFLLFIYFLKGGGRGRYLFYLFLSLHFCFFSFWGEVYAYTVDWWSGEFYDLLHRYLSTSGVTWKWTSL